MTLTVRSNVGDDGTLRLEVPCGLAPGPVDVVVVVQPIGVKTEPATNPEHPPRPARSGLFLNRGLAGVDVDAVTAEIDSAWKAKLADLAP